MTDSDQEREREVLRCMLATKHNPHKKEPWKALDDRYRDGIPYSAYPGTSHPTSISRSAFVIFKHRIPELSAYPNGFPGHWMRVMFMGGTGPSTYKGRALISTFVRVVEGAFDHYRAGRGSVLKFIEREDSSHIPMFEILRASTSFEDCIVHTHRAVRCMEKIRGYQVVDEPIKALFRERPNFVRDFAKRKIEGIRDAVQHNYQMIFGSEIPENTAFMLSIGGPTVPVPDEPGQEVRTFDRLTLGVHEIMFTDLVAYLEEMGHCAERLAAYEPPADGLGIFH